MSPWPWQVRNSWQQQQLEEPGRSEPIHSVQFILIFHLSSWSPCTLGIYKELNGLQRTVHVCVCIPQYVCGGQDNFVNSVFSFCLHHGSKDQLQSSSLCGKHCYPLSHLAGPLPPRFDVFVWHYYLLVCISMRQRTVCIVSTSILLYLYHTLKLSYMST